MDMMVICPDCMGEKVLLEKLVSATCDLCEGEGLVRDHESCPACDTTGEIEYHPPCPRCRKTGWIPNPEFMEEA